MNSEKAISITAHSGCDETEDNSIEFVKHALTLPIDAFEVDVYELQDELVLSHDAPADGDCVRLNDVFQLLSQHENMKINCDLKQSDLEEKVMKLAKDHGVENRVLFSGITNIRSNKDIKDRILVNAEVLIPDIYQRNHIFRYEDTNSLIAKCKQFDLKVLNIDYRFISNYFVELAERENIGLSFWTVNESDDIRRMLACSPRNITSRKPMKVLSIMEEMKHV